jgi:hypothetical protein
LLKEKSRIANEPEFTAGVLHVNPSAETSKAKDGSPMTLFDTRSLNLTHILGIFIFPELSLNYSKPIPEILILVFPEIGPLVG